MRELIRFDERLLVLVSKGLYYLSHFKLYNITHVITKSDPRC